MSDRFFKNRNVANPRDFTVTKTAGGAISSADDITMTPKPGAISEAGTAHNASNMNRLFEGRGRTQSEFDFNGAELTDVTDVDGVIELSEGVTGGLDTAVSRTADDSSNATITYKAGLKFTPNLSLDSVKTQISVNTTGATVAYLQDASNTQLDTMDITGLSEFTFAYSFVAGTSYYIVIDNGGSTYTMGFKSSIVYPFVGTGLNIIKGYNGTDRDTGYAINDLQGFITVVPPKTTGTIEKTYSPSDLRAWDNLKVLVENLSATNNLYYKLDDRLIVEGRSLLGTFNASSQSASMRKCFYNSDGTKGYLYTNTQIIYQYSLSTPYLFTTATYDSKSFNVSTQVGGLRSACFNSDNTKLYALNDVDQSIYQYTLSTGSDISTASYDSKSFDASTQTVDAQAIFLKDDTRLWISCVTNDLIYQYTLSTSSDISTASYDSKSFDVSNETSTPKDIFIGNSGDSLYVLGTTESEIFQYTLSTSDDISTASYDSKSFDVSNTVTIEGFTISHGGDYLSFLQQTTDVITQYSLSVSWEIGEVVTTDTPIVAYTEITENGVNVIDLSTIDLTTYPNDLVLTFKEERDASGDTSPKISDNSITWEGAGGRILFDKGVTLTAVAQIDVPIPSSNRVIIKIRNYKTSVGNEIWLRFDSDTGGNYGNARQLINADAGATGATYVMLLSPLSTTVSGDLVIEFNNDGNTIIGRWYGARSNGGCIMGSFTYFGATTVSNMNLLANSGNSEANIEYEVYYE